MRTSKIIHVVTCHAEGEVGDVIVGGVAPPPGGTLWEQSRFIASDGALRDFLFNEPRGGVFRHVNLLVPPKNPKAQMGFIIMEPEDTPPMSGSNAICVATVLLDAGILPMQEPRNALHARSARRAGRRHRRVPQRQGRAHLDRKRALVRRQARCAARGRRALARSRSTSLTAATVSSSSTRRARLRDPAGRSARPRRNGRPHHRRRQRAARLLPSRAQRLGPHLVLSLRRAARARGKRASKRARLRRPPRQDRPLPDRDRLLGPHGRFKRARAHARGRRLSRPLDHRLGVRLPHRPACHGGRPAGDHPDYFRPGLDYRD